MARKIRRLYGRRDNPEFRSALFAGILGGIVNVLVDIDHIPGFWGGRSLPNSIRRYLLPLALSLPIASHVLEDYFVKEF